MSIAARFACFRHESFCRPGMWLTNLTVALEYAGDGHLHANCVVDDFGTLRMVEVFGLTDGPVVRVETLERSQ